MGKSEKEKEQRKLKLEEWKNKGAEWCATQLWNARRQLEEARRDATFERHERWRERAEKDVDYRAVKKANVIMAEVLEKNGIRPTKLRITYVDTDCENCPCNGSENGVWDCQGCGEEFGGVVYRENEQIYTADVAFYTYLISGNWMEGITAQFEESQYDLIKVVDERTGEIIGEWGYREGREEDE